MNFIYFIIIFILITAYIYLLQLKLYNTVIEDVISGVRESFIDEGVDEQVLQELKQIWETKLMSSKAVELNPDPPEPQVPQINTHKTVNKGNIYILLYIILYLIIYIYI